MASTGGWILPEFVNELPDLGFGVGSIGAASEDLDWTEGGAQAVPVRLLVGDHRGSLLFLYRRMLLPGTRPLNRLVQEAGRTGCRQLESGPREVPGTGTFHEV